MFRLRILNDIGLELFLPIEGYEDYKVSTYGRIKSFKSNKDKLLSIQKNPDGYQHVNLSSNGKCKTFDVHKLVLITFMPNPNNYPCINHKDENSENNRLDNLEWCNHQYNNTYGNHTQKQIDAQKKKTVLQYDLSNKLIKEWISAHEIQRQLGYSRGTIGSCCRGDRNTAYGFVWKYKD